MDKKKGVLLTVFLIFLIMPFSSAFNASSDVYSIGSYHLGSAGNTQEGTNHASRDTITYQQAGNDNATSEIYSLNLGWFERIITGKEEAAAEVEAATGGGGGRTVQFDISVSDIKISGEEPADPGQLFDITFSLENSLIENSDELTAIVTFEEFGLESFPIELGKFFDFTYFLKGVGTINNDVKIDFWIEKDGEIITSGSDAVFMGVNEEKNQTSRLFLPKDITSGNYKLVIRVNYGTFTTESHRTMELTVSGDEAIATPAVDLTFIILDEEGKVIYIEEDSIVVETEELFKKSFEGLDLPRGKYTLVLQILYNANVFDKFQQDFEIKKEGAIAIHLRKNGFYYLIGIIIGLIIIILLILIGKHKKKSEEEKEGKIVIGKHKKKDRVRLRKDKTMRKAGEVRKKKQKGLSEREKIRISEVKKKIKKLERKKDLLEKGYQAGYIDEKSYQMDIKKLEKLISRLRRLLGKHL